MTFRCGHPKSSENTYTRPRDGVRLCRMCRRASAKRWKDANREYNRARDRERSRQPETRGICESPICTNLRGAHALSRKGRRGYCIECLRAIRDVRQSLGEGMWAEGWSVREWADALGVTVGYLGPARRRGWDLPYRYAAVAEKHAEAA